MLPLVATWLLTLGAARVLATDSGELLLLVNLVTLFGGIYMLTARIATDPTFSSGLARSLLIALLPILWYLTKVFTATYEVAAYHHFRELIGAVIPGFVFGAVTAGAIVARLGPETSARIEERRWTELMLRLNSLTLCGIAAYLASNLRLDILLVSSDNVPGAETYQVLGDALTVNLFTAYLLARVDAAHGGAPAHGVGWLLGLPLLVIATIVCGVLAGSNKVVLIAMIVSMLLFVPPVWHWLADYPARGLLVTILVVGLAIGGLWLSGAQEQMGDLLGQTRLLDYGNSESVFETPSFASRGAVLAECGARQFSHAPVFGDLSVEYYSCGGGYYLHSLLSVQTHLGAVGSVLFAATLLRGAWVLSTRREFRPGWTVLLVTCFVGLIATFFTWMPFWYLLGLLACLPPRQSAHTDSPGITSSELTNAR